jgi:hypothetical protein
MDTLTHDITHLLDKISRSGGAAYEELLYEKSFYKYPLIMNYALLSNKIDDYECDGSTEEFTSAEPNIKRYVALFEISTLLFNYLSAAKMFEDNTYCFLNKYYCQDQFLRKYEEYYKENIKQNADCRLVKDLRNLGVHKTAPAIFLQTKNSADIVVTEVLFDCENLLQGYSRWSSTSRTMLSNHRNKNEWLSIKDVAARYYASVINLEAFLNNLLVVHHAEDIAELYALRKCYAKHGSPSGNKFPYAPINDILQRVEQKYVG